MGDTQRAPPQKFAFCMFSTCVPFFESGNMSHLMSKPLNCAQTELAHSPQGNPETEWAAGWREPHQALWSLRERHVCTFGTGAGYDRRSAEVLASPADFQRWQEGGNMHGAAFAVLFGAFFAALFCRAFGETLHTRIFNFFFLKPRVDG